MSKKPIVLTVADIENIPFEELDYQEVSSIWPALIKHVKELEAELEVYEKSIFKNSSKLTH